MKVPRRSLAVVVAVVLAALASAAAYTRLHSAQQRADKNATPTAVYVLKGIVPRNESAAAAYLQGLITTTRLPLQFVPAGAVTNLSAIRNREAVYNLPAGEVVVNAMFVPPKANSSLAAETVPNGDVAVTVSVDQVHGVAGLIQPGDKVDILVNIHSETEAYLYQYVPVLGVGTTLVPVPGSTSTAQTKADTQAADLITFAVPRPAATRIALANSGGGGVAGGLYLALVAARDATAAATIISGISFTLGGPTNVPTTVPTSNPGTNPGHTGPPTVTGKNLIPGTHLGQTLNLGGKPLIPSPIKQGYAPTP
jgi:pilus assembly protein CpaB